MQFDEFKEAMEKLHRSFDALPYSGKELDAYGHKIIEWFELWNRLCKGDDKGLLDRVAQKSIERYDRRPSFAQLKTVRDEIVRSLPPEARLKIQCDCDSGMILASKIHPDYGPAIYAFRCDKCENWLGYADALPLWLEEFKDKGYTKIT